MNQIIALLLAGLLCLSAAGCARNMEDVPAPADPPVEQTPDADPVPISQPVTVEEPEPETVWEVPDTARLSLLQTEYPVGTEKVTLVIENTGDAEIGYGLHFSCVKFVDGQWSRDNYADGLMFIEIMSIVKPHSVQTMELDWSLLHRPLDEGLYRVTGSKLWIGQGETDAVTDPWQLDFRVTKDAQPEPDFALVVQNQPVSTLEETLSLHFINNTGAEGYVQSIPHLERLRDAGEWAEVPWKDIVGFCGTPDPLPVTGRDWSENVQQLWGRLEEGQYRLSYKVGREFETEETVYGAFTVCAPELMICGYPPADQQE